MEHLEVEFLQQDKYISENEYKEFIDKNNLKVDMQKLMRRNRHEINLYIFSRTIHTKSSVSH